MPYPHYEARHSEGLRNKFDNLGFFAVHLMHSTQVVLQFARVKMWLQRPGLHSETSCLAAQCHNHEASTTGTILFLPFTSGKAMSAVKEALSTKFC